MLAWNIHGQLEARIEAFGTPVERTTIWTYDSTFPDLWTSVEQESTSGAMDFRRTERAFDGNGRLISETIEGVENLVPFSLVTVHTPTTEGMTGVIDPPGYGTADRTSFTYDPSRGNLVAPPIRCPPYSVPAS